ncbi:MAG: hypothetical protein WCE69_15005 [Aestuariivirga sp.]
MIVSRLIGIAIAILLVVVSMNVSAVASVATCVPQQHHSAGGQPDHRAAAPAGCHDLAAQDCCLGSYCVATGILAEAVVVATPSRSLDLPEPGLSLPLFGRLIAPETGPPKRLA